MKEQIKKIIMTIKMQNTRTIAIYAGIFLIVIISTIYYFSKSTNTDAEIVMDSTEIVNPEDGIVSILGANDFLTEKDTLNNSWPAEIISNEISQIQPQREGVLMDWRVRVGEYVRQGQILGKISAPPATPELIQMLSEKTESLARAKAESNVTDEYTKNEQIRLNALKESLNSGPLIDTELVFASLERLRDNVEVKYNTLRTLIERSLANHVATVTNYSNWKYFLSGGLNRGVYGSQSMEVQSLYETALITLVNKMKGDTDLPIKDAQTYFGLAIQLANNTVSDTANFKAMANMDQKEFLDMLYDYKMAQSEVASMKTEYETMIREKSLMLEKDKSMVQEKSLMLEKDRSMAHANAEAVKASYSTVYNEIKGETYIRAPRSGTISAIYKKVGNLVGPEMAIAVIVGGNNTNLIARIHIPNNILKPKVGEILIATRPGFPKDTREVKIVGIGSSLDETGSYMADAIFIGKIDWPIESSIRVTASATSNPPIIKYSSVIWGIDGKATVWAVSEAGRIYSRPIKIGRVLGTTVEIYEGLKNGDKYISSPNSDIRENMLLEEIIGAPSLKSSVENPVKKEKSKGHDNDDGHGH